MPRRQLIPLAGCNTLALSRSTWLDGLVQDRGTQLWTGLALPRGIGNPWGARLQTTGVLQRACNLLPDSLSRSTGVVTHAHAHAVPRSLVFPLLFMLILSQMLMLMHMLLLLHSASNQIISCQTVA